MKIEELYWDNYFSLFIDISLSWLNLRKYSYKWKENANTRDLKTSK